VNKTTVSAKPAEVKREWFVIDAAGKTLGNVATECARRLRGKHKAIYTPHVDTGDYMVVINASQVVVTGNKAKNKMYHRHTGYIGNLKTTSFEKLQQTHPERIIELAVKGMLPKNALGRDMYRKLRVFSGAKHNHEAQQPQLLELK
jgi:large subunit ribosomal protein L13